jgi:acyl-CoA synthetase (AMP-forming)/AMP-acid ligase II
LHCIVANAFRYLPENILSLEGTVDPEGFFRSGDLVQKIGENLLHARSSIDFMVRPFPSTLCAGMGLLLIWAKAIRFSGWKILPLDIDTALHSLPYSSTATVFGTEDIACHQRVAAMIPPNPIARIRILDLAATCLPRYKFPTAVYWLGSDEELPLMGSGKISNRAAKDKFFGPSYEGRRWWKSWIWQE